MCTVCEKGLPAYIVAFDLPDEEKAAMERPGSRSISIVTLTLDEGNAKAAVSVYQHRGMPAYYRTVRLGPDDLQRLGTLLAHATEWDLRDLPPTDSKAATA